MKPIRGRPILMESIKWSKNVKIIRFDVEKNTVALYRSKTHHGRRYTRYCDENRFYFLVSPSIVIYQEVLLQQKGDQFIQQTDNFSLYIGLDNFMCGSIFI